jgi:Tol biopolymer transport system component
MRDLALRNGLEIRDVSWQYDVDRLIEALEKIEGPQPAEPDDPGLRRRDYRSNGGGPFDRKRVGIAAGAVLLVLAAIGGFLLLRDGADGGTVPGTTELVYAGSGRLFIVSTDGSNERSLKGGRSRQPDWSPRGDRIAVNRAADIVVLDTAGNDVGRLTRGESVDDAPSWSPDQTRVAFDRQETPGSSRTDVFVVDMDGNAKNLTEEPGRTGGQPDWSPDGDRIVFQRRGAMFVMSSDGTGEERLQLSVPGAVHEPAWSPDGTQIAVAIDANPTDIYLFSLAGRTLRNLTDGRATNPRFPSWSSDGTLAFAAADGIWTIKRDGSGLTQVIEGERLEAPSWRK